MLDTLPVIAQLLIVWLITGLLGLVIAAIFKFTGG